MFVASVATPAVEVMTVVMVDPPASVDVTTDVMTARDDVVVGGVEDGVVEVELGVVVVDKGVVLVLVLLIDVELDEGKTTVLDVSEEDNSVEMPDEEGLLLAIELEDDGTEARELEDGDGVWEKDVVSGAPVVVLELFDAMVNCLNLRSLGRLYIVMSAKRTPS